MAEKHWRKLGEVYREAVDAPLDEQLARTQRERLALAAARGASDGAVSARTPWWRWAALGAALAGSAALAIVLLAVPEAPEQPRCHTADGKPVGEGQRLVASNEVVALRFGDGSRVDLGLGSALLTKRLAAGEVELVLERGQLKARVQKAKRRVWRYRAGPYRVRVVGTAFEMSWDNTAQRLRVAVARGVVTVKGGKIASGGQRVTAGQSIEADPQAARLVQPKAMTPDAGARQADARAPAVDKRVPDSSIGRKHTSRASLSRRWRKLMLQGHHDAAWREVERIGLSKLHAKAPGADLLLLADLARLRGSLALARSTLLSIRKRFAGRPSAALAAFELGRMAERKGKHARAEHYFQKYLAEQPHGKRAADALGRQMVALGKLGRRADARRKAKDYLAAYPKGAYARVAKALAKE